MNAIVSYLVTNLGPLVIKLASSFVLRQVLKFKEGLDLSKVRADCKARIADLLPGEDFDALGQSAVDALFDIVDAFLKDKVTNAENVKLALSHADNVINEAMINSGKESLSDWKAGC